MDRCQAIDSVGFVCVLYRGHNGPHSAVLQWEDRDAFYPEEGESYELEPLNVWQSDEEIAERKVKKSTLKNYPNILISGRQTGRTTELIRWAAEEQKYPLGRMRFIVCMSQREAIRIFRVAEDMGLSIRFPVTWREMMEWNPRFRDAEFGIDNLSLMLPQLLHHVKLGPVIW